MLPIDFLGTNITFTKPAGWKDEDCSDLQAFLGIGEDGNHFVLTAWKPSKEDIDAINRGEPIYMKTTGAGFIPTFMFTLNENDEPNF